MDARRVAVTGAHGFLGKAVMKRLPDAYVVESDLYAPINLRMELEEANAQVLVHLGSPSPGGIGRMAEDPFHVADVVLADLMVVRKAVETGIERIVTVGSLCSYDPLDSVNGPYGVAKKMLEALLVAAHRRTGMSYAFLELTNLYGPGDQSDHLIPMAIRKIKAAKASGEPPVFWGTGEEERAFLHVDDAATVIANLVPLSGCLSCRPGPWTVRTVREVVRLLAAYLEYDGWRVRYDPTQPSTARRLPEEDWTIGLPQRDWPDALKEIVDAWRDR